MNTKELVLPVVLPPGWRKAVAKALELHPNTIYHAMKRGGDDPTYQRIVIALKVKYGKKPIKKEE